MKDSQFTKILAYIHRYAFMAVLLNYFFSSKYLFGIVLITYGLWTILGYNLKWTHIFCSFQNEYNKKMTPNNVNWNKVKKIDVYFISVFFILSGLCIIVLF